MASAEKQFEALIASLSIKVGKTLPLEDGLCSLENQAGETVINIELAESGERLLLHRLLLPMPTDPDLRNGRAMQLLALNSHQSQLSGHWFCTDPEGLGVHLMASYPIANLAEDEFEQVTERFIELGADLAENLQAEEIEYSAEELKQGIRP
ncbi:hypothetical protein EOPP23_01630 [Endozoicomonas sp. OPT23]|uniref:CesT family type III secretion system chaperone n=1 Tax=Endozoicomonas sp. OPT23 TaxID=2072845 RepID=UPI00129AA3D5|nr:CesT family type III secretion system chaperone [Endozoicomonas sp. OPT23]MRI31695.1 hypothetical protein [Endozoicomonas sp. OPT23]